MGCVFYLGGGPSAHTGGMWGEGRRPPNKARHPQGPRELSASVSPRGELGVSVHQVRQPLDGGWLPGPRAGGGAAGLSEALEGPPGSGVALTPGPEAAGVCSQVEA